MKQVWKYRIPGPGDDPWIEIPVGSQLLHVAVQDGVPHLWALVDPDAPTCRRPVVTFATGEPIVGDPDYIGTFHIDWTVWHVFTTDTEMPLEAR